MLVSPLVLEKQIEKHFLLQFDRPGRVGWLENFRVLREDSLVRTDYDFSQVDRRFLEQISRIKWIGQCEIDRYLVYLRQSVVDLHRRLVETIWFQRSVGERERERERERVG